MSPWAESRTGVPDARNKPLRVAGFVATRLSDADRGPQVRLAPEEAAARLLTNGELAWVHGPRRQQLAEVVLDPEVKRGDVVLRDVAGVSPSEIVRVVKPDLDSHTRRGHFA
jgi:anaerobic selenocysteine-containing dehydrogenase